MSVCTWPKASTRTGLCSHINHSPLAYESGFDHVHDKVWDMQTPCQKALFRTQAAVATVFSGSQLDSVSTPSLRMDGFETSGSGKCGSNLTIFDVVILHISMWVLCPHDGRITRGGVARTPKNTIPGSDRRGWFSVSSA